MSVRLSPLFRFVLALTLVLAACIESRPRRARGKPDADAPAVPAAIVGADAVDGGLDHLVTGERTLVPIDADDAMTGAAEPLVTIVEFSDFECPFCGRLAATMSGMLARYPDDVRLVFKQFPLPMHARAEPAARAAMAAGAQGKFWPMHDALFADLERLSDDDILGYAKRIGLDVPAFQAALADPATLERVLDEANEGRVVEVQSTPTFFVNGRRVTGAKDADTIAQIIDEEIMTARALIAAGAKRSELYARFMHAAKPGAGKPATVDPTHKRGEASAQANYAIPIGADRPWTGPADALVTIVAYGDYGCEGCDGAWATLRGVMQKHPEVRVAVRYLPTGRDATLAAKSALAAHAQGKFWPMHDRLVAASKGIVGAPLRRHARELELDLERFDRDLQDPVLTAMLTEDAAVADQVRGTAPAPFFFVNGRFLRAEATAADFDTLIEGETVNAGMFIKAESVSPAESYEAMRKGWRGFKSIEAVTKAPPLPRAEAAAPKAVADTPVRGEPGAKVVIVACTDFDCPACVRGAGVLAAVREAYRDDVAIQFRHYAPNKTGNARAAHLAAAAAARQEKFWQVHDLLYARKGKRSDAELEAIATTAELDLAMWKQALADPDLAARIDEDTAACGSLGVGTLPSYVIGTQVVAGAQPLDRFRAIIDPLLAK
ncbi:MAG: thioredoxin domain-containing protein [Nannocystaceae bacterium]|nr:thioredoxin domain-containing protein [Nannocystaceae bacterium]